MRKMPRAKVVVFLAGSGRDGLHSLTEKALKEIEERVSLHEWGKESGQSTLDALIQNEFGEAGIIDICIDGLLGLGFQPPMKEGLSKIVSLINESEGINVRVSIDIPSGLSEFQVNDELYFQTRFSAFTGRNVFKTLRPVNAEKRVYGHLFIIAGSALMPGALLMSVKAAIQSGAGLVTAFAPGSIIPSLSAQVPEAMWIPLPETNFGTISARASDVILSYINNATAIMAGPGLGRSRDTEMVIQEILQKTKIVYEKIETSLKV